jgi:hypothetical protein
LSRTPEPYCFILLVFVGLTANAQNIASVSLKDTLEWMHNFSADHATQLTGHGGGGDGICKIGTPNCVERFDSTTFGSQGCSATLTWLITLDGHEWNKDIYQFSLKDLDPESVTFGKSWPFLLAVHAETTNNEKKVYQVINGRVPTDGAQTFIEVVFNYPDDGKRFAKALKHAIKLCGGKPSVF